MAVDLTLPDQQDYWKNRARAAEEALKTLSQCFAILCDREEENTIILTDKELIEIQGHPIIMTFHDKEKAEMRIQHVKE